MAKRSFFSALLLLASLLTACVSGGQKQVKTTNGLSWTVQELVDLSRKASQQAMVAITGKEKKEAALRGIDYAGKCLERAPEEAACYYYRAVNTGYYYEAHVIGYQKGVRQMIEDAEKVIALQPNYDHAGAYRILGELYTRLPQTTVRPDGITRDLDAAEKYLRIAVRIASDYPENYLLLAETLMAKDDLPGALKALAMAKELAPRWQKDAAYHQWRRSTERLEDRIAKLQ